MHCIDDLPYTYGHHVSHTYRTAVARQESDRIVLAHQTRQGALQCADDGDAAEDGGRGGDWEWAVGGDDLVSGSRGGAGQGNEVGRRDARGGRDVRQLDGAQW